jgi:hypothetical protein
VPVNVVDTLQTWLALFACFVSNRDSSPLTISRLKNIATRALLAAPEADPAVETALPARHAISVAWRRQRQRSATACCNLRTVSALHPATLSRIAR